MITDLNLASQPFRNRTLPWAVAAAVASVSLVALIFIIAATSQANAQADSAESQLRSLREREAAMQAEAAQIRGALTPDQQRVLEAAHALVDRKRFSWSRLYADLEASMPASVRVTRISVRDATHSGAQILAELNLTVVGRTPADVTDMIRQMERTGIFGVEPLQETVSRQSRAGESGTEWVLRVRYTPRMSLPDESAPQSASTDVASTAPATAERSAQTAATPSAAAQAAGEGAP